MRTDMPQKSAIPLADRVRENQRRSRARRKELIHELTDKLRDFEKREAQATVAMQRAARRVLWENEQLRDLLAIKGVTKEEISNHLQEREAKPQEVVLNMAEPTSDRCLPEPEQRTDSSMSCENAASIIAGMRGHNEDEELVRFKLGCASSQTCKVKNVQVLQVMEEE